MTDSAPSTANAIETIMEATVNWQITMQKNQVDTATTVDQAATALMKMYTNANSALSKLMKAGGTWGMPNSKTSGGGTNKNYSEDINKWQTHYNLISQEWQNLENTWNTTTQNGGTQEQSLSNQVSDASSLVPSILQPETTAGNLIASPL